MPFPGEHACRLRDPGQYERFRRLNDVNPNVILGFKEDGSSEPQALRYPIEKWSEDEARKHCDGHDGSFEGAST